MKKSILGMLAIASMAIASCTQEVEMLAMDDMKNVEFTGTIENVSTRTSMDNAGKVIWCESDPISIFMRNGDHYKYQSNSGGSNQTTFAYADWYSEGSNTLDKNYAVYPFAEGNTFDAATKKFTVNLSELASQIYTEGSFEEGISVMTAKSDGKSLPFYNALSMLKVSLKSQVPHAYRIKTIEIQSSSLFLNSESATIDMSQDGNAAVLESGNKANTLSCGDGVVLSTEYTDFYILVPANEVPANDFTIKITYIDEFTGEEGNREETINKPFRFVRSKWVEYKRDFDDEEWDGTIIPNTAITTAAELQKALDEATDGTTIVLADDITGDVTITQKPDVKITIDGRGFNFAGVITVDGKSATYTTAGLTIKDLKFNATSISAEACINLGVDGDNNTRYTCNVTVDGCEFDVPDAVGIKSYTGGDKNLTITNCSATTRAHSLLQAKGIDGILVTGCTVYSKNGLNFNNSTNVTVDGCTVDVRGYAARFGETSGGTGAAEVYSIKNSSLKTDNSEGDAVIILRGTADNSTLKIDNTTIEGTLKITNTATNAIVIIDGVVTVTVPENNTEDIVLSNGTVNVTVPETETEAGDIYKIEVKDESTVTDNTTGETTVAFDLTMYKNDVKVSGTTVYAVTKNIGTGLFISEVTHNGIALTMADTGADQTYTYDSVTGVLTIYTASFSPFAITYAKPKETFADNSWEHIILACQSNNIPSTWNVGDKKTMTIGGSTYDIAIIGKNHDSYSDNSGKAPLTFQLAEVYGTTAAMNATQTNATGWSGSKMRTTTMTEILSAMPSEIQNAIKAVDKETLKGDGSGLETTSDKLFLLSLFEVYGSTFYSNGYEEGSTYDYYSNKDNRIMNASWWLRGPGINNGKNNGIGFTQINMSGYMANGSAEYACGVVFGFCF